MVLRTDDDFDDGAIGLKRGEMKTQQARDWRIASRSPFFEDVPAQKAPSIC